MSSALPTDRHITYVKSYRKCGKPSCRCHAREQQGHGPYWYAFWYGDDKKLKSRYIGKTRPETKEPVNDSTA